MNRPIDIEMMETKQKIIGVMNESLLPACIMRFIVSEISEMVNRAADQDYAAHMAELERQKQMAALEAEPETGSEAEETGSEPAETESKAEETGSEEQPTEPDQEE